MTKGIDYTGVTVVYFCHDGKGKFLMMKRGKNARDEHGNWDIGGGALEFGATVEEALRKEVKEEYCADVLDHEFLGFLDVHRTQNSRKTHWVALCFRVLVDPAQIKIGEPHKFDDIGWFTLDTMPSDLHSHLPSLIQKFKHKLTTT